MASERKALERYAGAAGSRRQPRKPGDSRICAASTRTAFDATGPVVGEPGSLVELDVSGLDRRRRAGHRTSSACRRASRFERLDENHPLLGTLVGWNEKFAAHNAALWQNGVLVHVPNGVEVERPIYVRLQNTIDGGSLFWRLLVVAEEGSRCTLIEEYASASPDLHGYSNAVAELFVGQAAKLEYVSIQNLSHETWHFATHHARVERDAELDWVAGGFGSKKGKIRIQNDLSGPGATSRVTGAYFADGDQHLDYDTFQEHMAPSTESDFAFKGALREQAHAVWRGMIRVEEDAQKTNAYQENRNLLLSENAHADSIPRPRDHGQRRPLHPRRDDRPGRPERALLPDDARPLPCRGGAPDRPRVLPGHPRPDRPRAGSRGSRRGARGAHSPGGVAPS